MNWLCVVAKTFSFIDPFIYLNSSSVMWMLYHAIAIKIVPLDLLIISLPSHMQSQAQMKENLV